MKKKVFFILLLLLFPIFVNAETIKVGDNSYNIEEIENVCTKANLVLDHYDEKGAVCLDPADGFTKMYRVDDKGVKKELTNQEYLDYYNAFGNVSYHFHGSENVIYKISGNDIPGYIEIPFDQIDTNKVYAIIEGDGNGNYSYSYTNELGYVFDPSITYYEMINLAFPKSADVKTDGSVIYYTCNSVQICEELKAEDIKAEDVLSYYVASANPYKEEKVATIDTLLFEKIKAPKEGVTSQNYNVYKIPNKDMYYIWYEEQTATTSTTLVYTHDGELVFENIDTFGVINDDLIYTLENGNIVIYNLAKEKLNGIPGEYMYMLYITGDRAIFSVDDNLSKIYEIKKLESEKFEQPTTEDNPKENEPVVEQEEVKPIVDLTNPDTGDTIISALVLGTVAVVGIIAVTKHKRKEN